MRIHPLTLAVALVFGGIDLTAAGLNITIEARVAGRRQTSANGQSPPAFTVKRGETLTVQWTATNPAPGPALSEVTMHTVLDKDAPATQSKAGSGALYEGAVNLDFRSGERSSGNFRMPMVEPGSYVLRVKSVGIKGQTGAKDGAESFATLKVIVQ